MLAADAPNLLFVIVVPLLGLAACFIIGTAVWKGIGRLIRR